jgi:type II secretory pathway pseudopilin PulG
MAKTPTGKSVQKYITDVLGTSTDAGKAAIAAGYPDQSSYTQAYLAGVPYLYQYGDAEQTQALNRMGGLYDAYGAAGDYNKTNFGDIEGMYGAAGQYDPAQYDMSDYTTQNIMSRMTPYEELVSGRAKERLKKAYGEGRGEREMQAARQDAFGGSGAAIQEEVARRNYLEQMADMDAKNLQAAYESGVGLYGREMTENLAAGQAEEASRQFGKQAEFDALSGQMGARRETAAQEAAAKEAQFAGLQGQGTSAQQQADLAQQKKEMQVANLSAMQQAGQQQQSEQLDKQEYGLDIAGKQANMLAPLSGGAIQTKANKPSTMQNILGGAAAAAGVAEGISGLFRDGGYVYRGGGLADLDPQYYARYRY